MNTKKGFTLIEIIIVLIIIGVLAAIALPAYFSWVARGAAMEALISLKTNKDRVILCLQAHSGSEENCSQFLTSTNFNYTVTTSHGSQVWQISATPNAFRYGLDPWGDFINMMSDSSGNITCQGGGNLRGIC